MPEPISSSDALIAALKQLDDQRRKQGLTRQEVAELAGVDRSTVGLWERGLRGAGFATLLQVCRAVNVHPSSVLERIEASCAGLLTPDLHTRPARDLRDSDFRNETAFRRMTGLPLAAVRSAIERCHWKLDVLDTQMDNSTARVVGLRRLSLIIRNFIADGIETGSRCRYVRKSGHVLTPTNNTGVPLAVKVALETNMPKERWPKGHLPKPGMYLTFRYVLCDKAGKFTRGKEARGEFACIWEARVGNLALTDFDLINTPGDSGKTAVIKTGSYDRMTLVYYHPGLLPYARARAGYPDGL